MGGVYHIYVVAAYYNYVATTIFTPEIGKISQNINHKDIKQFSWVHLWSGVYSIKYSQSRVDDFSSFTYSLVTILHVPPGKKSSGEWSWIYWTYSK